MISIKKMKLVRKWKDLEGIILGEMTQTQEKNESIFLHGPNSKDSKYKGMHALEQSEGHM